MPYNLYAFFCSYCGLAFAYLGKYQESQEYLEKSLNFAVKLNNVMDLGISEMMYGHYYLNKFEAQNLITKFQKSIRYFNLVGDPWFMALCLNNSGYGYYLLGDLPSALADIQKGYELIKTANVNMGISMFPLFLSYVYYDLKDFSKAKRLAEEAMELSIDCDHQIQALSRIFLGRIIASITISELSEVEKAETSILIGIKMLEELKLRPWLPQSYFYLGEFYHNTGRRDEALENLGKALSMCREMGIEYWPDKIQEVLNRL